MSWGTLGTTIDIEGASGRTWSLRFDRRLAPRESDSVTNPASSVWLVYDQNSNRFYAAKRQALASITEVDALVDEAAAWRAACLADDSLHIVELVDVFVNRTPPHSVTFLAEFCTRGLLPRTQLSEPVLLTLVADLSAAANVMPSPHAHVAYEALLVDAEGRLRLAGFGAHRSAILRDNPGLTPLDDAFDIGILLFELVFGHPPADDLTIPSGSPYSPTLISLIEMALTHPQPSELHAAALAAGAQPRAPVVDVEKPRAEVTAAAPEHVVRSTERNVDRLINGVDIATTFAALLSDLEADATAVANSIFKALFKKPVSKEPLCAVRAFTMLHNLMLDGPDAVLASIRQNDKFLDWAESSWTREAVEAKLKAGDSHDAVAFFAGGELSFYAALLRRKARFHQLAAGGFSGRWDRTGATNSDGRDVLETRRRKVISGMADIVEMAAELGCLFAGAKDQEAPAKHAGLGAMVSECCLAFNAALELAHEVYTVRDAEKLMPGIARLYAAARGLVFAVEVVPSAGGEPWVEQFANEEPPNVAADIQMKAQMADEADNGAEFPKEGWEGVDASVAEPQDEEKSKKKKKKKKKEKAEEEEKGDAEVGAEADITAEDGALVVHGADEASKNLTAMVGDLLRLDDGTAPPVEAEPELRPTPGMSNAQALASAFGVSEEAVAERYDDEPGHDGYGDEDDDEGGGYDDYQARQGGRGTGGGRGNRGPSTAAWAARSGYGTRALVVSEAATVKKSHPAFCQCAICQREEAEAEAEEAARRGSQMGNNGLDDGRGREEQYGSNGGAGGGHGNTREYERHGYDEQQDYRPRYGGDENGDSLDEDDGGYGSPKRRTEQHRSYYDDYDSYESVNYAMDDNAQPERERERGAPTAIPMAPPPATHHDMTQGGGYAPTVEVFKLDAGRTVNMKKLRMGDKVSDADPITVYKGEYNRESVAIKKVSKKGLQSAAALEEFRNEVRVTCSLSHANVVKCIAASLKKPNFVLVTEWMKRGTLFDILYKNRIKLTWALIKKMALQIAQGMSHVHEVGFLHRDLKSLNVLSDGGYDVKIGDFGLSCHVSEAAQGGGGGGGISGTYQYMAPEVLKGEPHSFKSDVYSFAIVLCEMVSGTPPFQGVDARQVAERVVNEDLRPTMPMHCQRPYVTIIQKCWATVPSIRPSFPEIVELIKVIQ